MLPVTATTDDQAAMRVKDLVKELTMTAGTVSSEMRRTMPTLRMQKTTASATNTAMTYDTVPVATPPAPGELGIEGDVHHRPQKTECQQEQNSD